jgi:hypothetical protein
VKSENLLQIFKEDTFFSTPETRVWIVIPEKLLPSGDVIIMLDKLLSALKISPSQRRFIWHNGTIPWKLLPADGTARILFFSDSPGAEVKKMKDPESGREWFLLPQLSLISSDHSVKKNVWAVLKD